MFLYIRRTANLLSPFASFEIYSGIEKPFAIAVDENRSFMAHIIKRLGKLRAIAPVRLIVRDLSGISMIEIESRLKLFVSTYMIKDNIHGRIYSLRSRYGLLPSKTSILSHSTGTIGKVISPIFLIGDLNHEVFYERDELVASFRWSGSMLWKGYNECLVDIKRPTEVWKNIVLSVALIRGLTVNQWSI